MASGTPRAYSNAIVSVGNSSRAVVRFRCVSCSHELEIANNNTRKHGSFYGAQARKRGWDTDGQSINRVFCPDCRKTPANRSRRQVELDSVVLPAMEPPTIDGTCEPWVDGFSPSVLRVVEGAASEMVAGIKEMVTVARDLTNEQRRQIRLLLDQYFDDKVGCYLVGEGGDPMSDQAIGSLAGVPWGEVTKIRELSYGRIMVDPALAVLRTQMDELHRAVQEQLAVIERRMNEMRAALDGYGRQARAS